MLKNNFISIDKKIYSLISLPLKIALTIIQEDEDLQNFDLKIIISDIINFKHNENYNEKNSKETIEIPTEITKDNIQNFIETLNDSKIRVINIKKEKSLLKIYIAKERYELLN